MTKHGPLYIIQTVIYSQRKLICIGLMYGDASTINHQEKATLINIPLIINLSIKMYINLIILQIAI